MTGGHFDVSRLLPFAAELGARDHDHYKEHVNDQRELVGIHLTAVRSIRGRYAYCRGGPPGPWLGPRSGLCS